MYAAIIISVVVHVVAIAWTVAGDSRAATCAVALAEPESEVLEVQWLGVVELAQNVKLAAPPDGERPATTQRRVRPGRISTAPSVVGTESAAEPAKLGGERSNLMTMRRPGQAPAATLGVSGEFLDELLRRSKPAPDPPDLPGARIDAEIAELRARMRNRNEGYDPTSDRQALVALRAARKQVELQLQKDGTYEADKPTFVAKVDRDGKLHFHDKPNLQPEGLGARFDVTDAVMRSQRMDPYASAKLRFMDRTRDQRVAIGKEYRREVLSQSGELMRKNAERVWAGTKSVRERKQGLFELWDECAETGDEVLVAGGAEARKFITRYVQLKLQGPDAYTADELATLNARRTSKAVFAPYD